MSESICPKCPDNDALSAYVDGDRDAHVKGHIGNCTACRCIVDAYTGFDRAAKVLCRPPEGLPDRIKSRLRSLTPVSSAAAPLAGWHLSPALRMAAAVAITTAAIGTLVVTVNRHSGETSSLVADSSTAPELVTIADSWRPITINRSSLEKVGVGSGAASAAALPAAGTARPVNRTVRHVWSIDDAGAGLAMLRDAFPAGSYAVDNEDGNTVLTLVLPDRELQSQVDQLAERKWNLLSPELPQPSRAETMRFTGQPVSYKLVLAQR